MKSKVSAATVFEVGPRDGLQSEKLTLNLSERQAIIEGLSLTGLKDIEIGSFVRSDRIPQLAKTGELMKNLRRKFPKLAPKDSGKSASSPRFWAFVPNEHGLDDALVAEVDGVSLFTTLSETFARKNVNQGRDELLKNATGLLKSAKKNKIKSRVYLSTLHHCPFEGPMKTKDLVRTVETLVEAGCQEIALSDTTGHSLPHKVAESLDALLKKVDKKFLAFHFHDTRSLALPNVLVALEYGIHRFDSSFGGLGGCPYAPGAAGNLATEDLVYFLAGEKVLKAPVDLEKLAYVSRSVEKLLGRPLPSKVLKTLGDQNGIG
jgi:hydroxymethylglutaryl-CoA lyase